MRMNIFLDYCLFGFYGISTFVGYLMQNKQFYFKQFSLAYKNSSISNNSF